MDTTPAHRLIQAHASSSSGPLPTLLFSAAAASHPHSINPQRLADMVLREATVQERAKLAAAAAASSGQQQVGWHTHATHVFAIPFNVTLAATGVDAASAANAAADSSTQTATTPPLLPAPQQQQPQQSQQPQQQPQQQPPSTSSSSAQRGTQTDDPSPQVTVPRGLRVVVFHPPPTVPPRAYEDSALQESAAWWTGHPEYAQWVWETENRCYGERRIDRILQALDLSRHILAR